jgi:predicted GNAT family acetyltransferase
MKLPDTSKLDNPVWHSLSESHREYAINHRNIKFYQPEYCSFGGFENGEYISEHLDQYAALTESFFIVGEKPPISGKLQCVAELVCLQMVVHDKINLEITEEITLLTAQHTELLYELVTMVQPGYFNRKTILLGNYYGIFKEGTLVAVSGERMQMDDFIEVSAVVTHPQHTGKGYAGQLVAHTVNNIFRQYKSPFLHVLENNAGAIGLYHKLGFENRRKISFWKIKAAQP